MQHIQCEPYFTYTNLSQSSGIRFILIFIVCFFLTCSVFASSASNESSHCTGTSFKKSHHKHHAKSKHGRHLHKNIIHQQTPKTFPHLSHPLGSGDHDALSVLIPPTTFTSAIEQHLVNFVHVVVSTLHYSSYKLGGTHFDTSSGVYIVDCSDYVNHLLQVIYPNAYSDLLDSMGSDKPTSRLYYNFFNGLNDDPNHLWSKVEDAEELQPGDILVFQKKNSYGRISRGHVMVVMDKPIRDMNVLLVKVTDSAPSAHSEDTRQYHDSGIGIGTLLLKINPNTGHLSAYAWKENSHWESNVNFAMARPLEVG